MSYGDELNDDMMNEDLFSFAGQKAYYQPGDPLSLAILRSVLWEEFVDIQTHIFYTIFKHSEKVIFL